MARRKETARRKEIRGHDTVVNQKDPQHSRGKIKTSLEKALSEVKCSGSFLTSRSLENAINPGLDVLGVGPISLPLSAEVVNKIIQASHASPYGKGSQTLVDDSVRKSWELNADQFFLRNPAWAKQIESLLKEAVSGLGLMAQPKEIRAEIYKLVLYEEGAFFLPHQDSEKADGMFGTLVVSLPSKHEGGDVVATHKGESRTFSSSPGSDFGFSYAAWYSDVTHEVKPVTSGHRIVLTYNLIHRPSAMLLGDRDKLTTGLVSLLESWTGLCQEVFPTPDQPVEWLSDDEDACPTALLYMLDHKYTSAELSFARLKGADQARVAEIRKACEKTGFQVFLANIEKSEVGEVNDYYCCGRWSRNYDYEPHEHRHTLEDVIETNFVLSHVVEPEDRTFATEVDLYGDDDIIVQDDPFDDNPDGEDFEGYTGNEAATATHFYSSTGLLIIPPSFRIAFVLYAFRKGRMDVSPFLAEAHSAVLNRPDDDRALQNFRHLYRSIVSGGTGHRNSDIQTELYNSIIQIAIEFGDVDVLKRCLKLLGDRLSLSVGSHFGKAIPSLGFSNLQLMLGDFFNSNAGAIKKLRLVSNIISTYLSECKRLGVDAHSEAMQWQDDLLGKILSSWSCLHEADGRGAVDIIKNYPLDSVVKRLMLFLEKNVDNSGFVVGFLTCLHDSSQDIRLDQTEVTDIYKSILAKAIKVFKIDTLTQPQPRSGSSWYGAVEKRGPGQGSISWETMLKLFEQCDSMGIDTSDVLEVIRRRALELREEALESMYSQFFLPFISGLCLYLKSRTSRSATYTEQNFIVQLIEIYIRRYVKTPPKEPTDWKRTLTINCSCEDCRLLRRYVEDKHNKIGDFRLIEKRRRHIENWLDGTFRKATIRTGQQHTLRIEKTNERYKIDQKAWNNRATIAKSRLTALSKDCPLVDIIGEGSSTKLLQHESFESSVADSNLAPPSVSLAPNTTTVPKKRSFVDLTDA